MAMNTRGTRGNSLLMKLADAVSGKPKTAAKKAVIPKPLFPNTKMKDGETYRLPKKKGSRGKGTRLG